MPAKLMKNMQRVQEHDLYFCLGQGATGHVYETGSSQFTRIITHRIPDYIAKKVEPSLKWFASHPLKSQSGAVLGVVNIDGLSFDVPQPEEININNIVRNHLRDLENELDKQPKKEIFVLQKPHNK